MLKNLDVQMLLFILTLTSASFAQETVNVNDSNGKRHGVWRKNFNNTNELRYEGQFENGKEIGEFKFYTLKQGKSVLSATKQFNDQNDNADVKFFSSTGKLISEGQMDGKLNVGKWIFYHNKSDGIMSVETYNLKGLLEGEKIIYYPNGKIAETSNYKNGKLEGPNLIYSETGKLISSFTYSNDELHGTAKYYDADGNLASEGNYQHDRKHGTWKYYENGVLKDTKDHTRRSKNPARN